MKVSVNLPDEDVAFVDEYARRRGSPSRSSVLHQAIQLLRTSEMQDAYAAAWDEWEDGEDARLWSGTIDDRLGDAAR